MKGFGFSKIDGGFELTADGRLFLRHTRRDPFVRAGSGEGHYNMHHGNFIVTERLDELAALDEAEILDLRAGAEGLFEGAELRFSRGDDYSLTASCRIEEGRLILAFAASGSRGGSANRWRFSLPSEADEHIYGCGEQFSHLDLKGRSFPLWTSEQGVGRNKSSFITWQADVADNAGGDYWWTFFPLPTFISSRKLWFHLETKSWSSFDFSAPFRTELYSWSLPERLVVGSADSMTGVVRDLSGYFGRQPELPDWVHDGVILGIQGGTETCLGKLNRARKAGVPVAGIWAQDWQGINMTSFGQRLRWNWVWDQERYPGLDALIPRLESEGVRFLGYINPYVAKDKSLFQEASAAGYLARTASGGDYLADFGEFLAGIVDFTNPAAFEWYKGIIRKNLIGFGLAGWMADFGEYLPTDALLADGRNAELAHNEWPVLWARCIAEAVAEGRRPDGSAAAGNLLWFMRAGFTGSQKYSPLMWGGDQNVDWSEDDGLPSVIPAALSQGLCGHGLHHTDMGGYTTLFGMKRTKELFMRWAELAAFTPLMRGHEGNRPGDNWQFDSDDETLSHLARMGRLHAGLKPYIKAIVAENAREGFPVMRPLFFHHEEDPKAWVIKDEYLFGRDILVAPILVEGTVSRAVHFPRGEWVGIWDGKKVACEKSGGMDLVIAGPLGCPPAFVRGDSVWLETILTAVQVALAVPTLITTPKKA
ncbi:MAG: alpha-glucosidase [Spirochaetes bacterium]|nr:alpha-glucosidase [Spirochaetota bacterium]